MIPLLPELLDAIQNIVLHQEFNASDVALIAIAGVPIATMSLIISSVMFKAFDDYVTDETKDESESL